MTVPVAAGACTSSNAPVERRSDQATSIEPEAARNAVLALVRRNPERFIGNPDADRLSALPLVAVGPGRWQFGVFEIDTRNMTYSAMIGVESPEPYLYEGKLTLDGRTVVAQPPNLTRYHRARE